MKYNFASFTKQYVGTMHPLTDTPGHSFQERVGRDVDLDISRVKPFLQIIEMAYTRNSKP